MASAVRAPANGDNVVSARESAGFTIAAAAKRLGVAPERVVEWETELAEPTLNQLRRAAALYGTTVAALLSSQPRPVDDAAQRVPDFRRNHDRPMTQPVVAEIRKVRGRRARILELGAEFESLPAITLTRKTAKAAAVQVRRLIGVDVGTQRRFANERAALNSWIHAVEGLGALVFQASRIPTSEFLGLSLYEDVAPIILLNGADTPRRRIFTLFHELGHLLGRTSGVCDVFTPGDTESVCNAFGSAFLLPADEFVAELGELDPIASLERLSKVFRVSQSAIAVRMKTLEIIDSDQLSRQLEIARERAQRVEGENQSGFAPPHVLELRNLGERYVSTVLDALHNGVISPVDATYFLESKLPTIDRMEAELARRAIG
ncbi:ImmA/IrrE family metallo-endopeptidase [Nocardia sp. BMG51109]|uniref:helix-turn-helix domain-containing protein n=1 Tax=Nocardia sp. BMG51109 TaxID=1056816 RepID=UPI0004BCFA3A|nr:XRE family transcriptional regulator [Nocardia sp. BMG51109]